MKRYFDLQESKNLHVCECAISCTVHLAIGVLKTNVLLLANFLYARMQNLACAQMCKILLFASCMKGIMKKLGLGTYIFLMCKNAKSFTCAIVHFSPCIYGVMKTRGLGTCTFSIYKNAKSCTCANVEDLEFLYLACNR